MDDWNEVRIGDFAEVYDGPHATPKTVDEGPIFLGIDALQNGRLILGKTRHVTLSDFKKWTKRVTPQAGDIVFSYETRLGEAAIIPDGIDCCLGRRMGLVRVDVSKINPKFFLYQYISPSYQEFLASRTIHGATVDRIPLKDFPNFPFRVPPLDVQNEIVGLLGNIDNKIEANRRTNETLEAMAQAIFRDWSRKNEVELETCIASELIKQKILQIGDGYRAKNSELKEPGLPFIRAGNLKDGFSTDEADVLSEASIEKAGDKLSKVGDVAFTSKGTVGRFARVSAHTPKFVYSPQICFWRSLDPSSIRPSILYCWMTSPHFIDQLYGFAGQTDMAPYVSLRDQRMMKVPRFGASQHHVADKLDPLMELQANNVAENSTLTSVRDLLLPRLMSGEITLKDAETLAEAAE